MRTLKAELFYAIAKYLEEESCIEAAELVRRFIDENDILPKRVNTLGKVFDNDFKSYDAIFHEKDPRLLLRYYEVLVNLLKKKEWNVEGSDSIFGITARLDRCSKKLGPTGIASVRMYNCKQDLFSGYVFRRQGEWLENTCFSLHSKLNLMGHNQAHRNAIYCILFDHRGEYIFTGSDDYTIKIWALHPSSTTRVFSIRHVLRGHVAEIIELALSADNHLLASVDSSSCLIIWCIRTGQPILSMRGSPVNRVLSGLSFLPVHTTEKNKVHNPLVNEMECSQNQSDPVNSSTHNPTISGWLAVTSFGGFLHLIPYEHHTRSDTDVVLRDPWSCCTITVHPPVRFTTAAEGTPIEFWPSITCMDVSPGSALIATGCSDQRVRLYHLVHPTKPELAAVLDAHEECVNSVAFSHSGLKLATGSSDGGSCWLWKFQTGLWRSTALTCRKRIKCRPCLLTWSQHDKYLIASMKNGSVYVYFGDSGRLVTVIEGHEGAIHSVAPSPLHEEILATAGVDGRFQIWHIERHRNYAAQQETPTFPGFGTDTGLVSNSDPGASSSSSPLLFYYRYPPGRFHLAAGVVWLPADSATPDQPIWPGARRAAREPGSGPGHEPNGDPHPYNSLGSSSQLHQRITACRALPAAEGVGFVLVTKNGLMSVFRPGVHEADDDLEDTMMTTWGDHTTSVAQRFDPNSGVNKVDEQFFHWELDTVVWRPTVIDESDEAAVRAFQQTASILGSPVASQAAGVHCRVRGQRNPRTGGLLGRQSRGTNRGDNSNEGSTTDQTSGTANASPDVANITYKPPSTVLFEIIHDPSGVPFHRLPPPYLTNFVGAPLPAEVQLRVPGRLCLDHPMDLIPTLTIDEDGVDIVLDDIQFCSNVPPGYCPPIRSPPVRPMANKTYLWQSLWLDGRHALIEPLNETEMALQWEQLHSLFRAEVEYYLSKGDAVSSAGEVAPTTDKPYINIQPTQSVFGVPDPRHLTLYQEMLSSLDNSQGRANAMTRMVTDVAGLIEPPPEVPGPSFLHAFLAKRFETRTNNGQNGHNVGSSVSQNRDPPGCTLNSEENAVPLYAPQTSNVDPNHSVPANPNGQPTDQAAYELDDADDDDPDEASEESEWSEHIDVEIGWWHRQRRRQRPRRSATAQDNHEHLGTSDATSVLDGSNALSGESARRRSRTQRQRNRRSRLAHSAVRYQSGQHQARRQQRRVGVSVRPCRRSMRQQHRLMLRRRILREMRLAEARAEREGHHEVRRSERRLRSRMRRSSRSSLPAEGPSPPSVVDSTPVNTSASDARPAELDLIPARREQLKRRLIRSMDYALFTASSVPLSVVPPEGYLGPDCEGPVYSSGPCESNLWPGPHFDWLSTLHPTATPYVPQVGDSLVYIVRGHREYLAQSWQNSELPALTSVTEHANDLPSTVTDQIGGLPWVSWPDIPPYTCAVVTEIHYTTVRTITDDSTARMPTSAPHRTAWRRRGSRSGVKHAGTSSKRLPTGSETLNQPGNSSSTQCSVVYSGDSFVRLVTLRLSVNPDDQPYAHVANSAAALGLRPGAKTNGPVFIDVTYHDVDGVLDFLILRHLFDAAIRRQWKRGDVFICPVGDVWWTGRVIHSPVNFLANPPPTLCQPSTSSAPVPLSQGVKDPWLACLIRWLDDAPSSEHTNEADDGVDDGLDRLIADLADPAGCLDTDSRDALPNNVDRLSPWDMHCPFANASQGGSDDLESSYPSQSQIRQIYGVPADTPHEHLDAEAPTEQSRRMRKWSSHAQTVLECFKEIMKLPASELFNQPVDLVSYPDYLFVNPYPVDFTLIVARLATGFYRQSAAVRSDLQHLLDNAIRYNRPDSEVVQHAHLVFQLATRALDSARFKPSQVSKEYERLMREESHSNLTQPGSSTRRSHSRSKSPGLESNCPRSTTPLRRTASGTESTRANTPCETRVCPTPTHRVRQSQRKRHARSRTDSSSETKTGSSVVDGDDVRRDDDPVDVDDLTRCSCTFPPNRWVPRCVSLLRQLHLHDRSMFFREPIDTGLYPDYQDIVSVPMDLSTVQKRLRNSLDVVHTRYRDLRSNGIQRRSAYSCPHAFVRDLRHIVRNSKLYNDDPETVVYEDTRWLESWIERTIVASLRRHGLWPDGESGPLRKEPHSVRIPRWRRTRGRRPSSAFGARSLLSTGSHQRRRRGRPPLYKRPRTQSTPLLEELHLQNHVEVATTSDLPHRTSSGRVVRPPIRNSGTIPYTSSLSSNESLSDTPSEEQTSVTKRGRRAHRSSVSPRRQSGTPGSDVRRGKRRRRRTERLRAASPSDSDDLDVQ